MSGAPGQDAENDAENDADHARYGVDEDGDSDHLIALRVNAPAWETALGDRARRCERAAWAALTAAGLEPARCAISLLLTDDAEIAGLNARYRGKAAPTNVLSWPAFPLSEPLSAAAFAALEAEPGEPRVFLGDVALAFETVQREAEQDRVLLEMYLARLIVHGVLHLLGYDHHTDEEAEAMESVERAALATIGAEAALAGPPVA